MYFNEYNTDVKKNTVKDAKAAKYSADDNTLNSDEVEILEALKLWRSEKQENRIFRHILLRPIKSLFLWQNTNLQKLKNFFDIKVSEKHKIENYGEEILEILDNV